MLTQLEDSLEEADDEKQTFKRSTIFSLIVFLKYRFALLLQEMPYYNLTVFIYRGIILFHI